MGRTGCGGGGGSKGTKDTPGVLPVPAAVRPPRALRSAPPADHRPRADYDDLRLILEPSHTSGAYVRSTARSFSGIRALSVILMPSGQTSVRHLVMLQ